MNLRDNRAAVFGGGALIGIVGTFIGGRLLGVAPSAFPLPLMAGVLIVSAVKVWRRG